jgi:hypothetical protein
LTASVRNAHLHLRTRFDLRHTLLQTAMIQTLLRRYVDPLHDAATARLGAGVLTGTAMALGILAAAFVAAHLYLWGLAFFVLNRIVAILARFPGGVAAIPIPDLLIYAALTFGFAIADPSRALASSFLLLGIVVLAGCAVLFGAKVAATSTASLVIDIVIFTAVALCCVLPERFSLVSYLFGLLCFPLAGTFAASSLVRRP